MMLYLLGFTPAAIWFFSTLLAWQVHRYACVVGFAILGCGSSYSTVVLVPDQPTLEYVVLKGLGALGSAALAGGFSYSYHRARRQDGPLPWVP